MECDWLFQFDDRAGSNLFKLLEPQVTVKFLNDCFCLLVSKCVGHFKQSRKPKAGGNVTVSN